MLGLAGLVGCLFVLLFFLGLFFVCLFFVSFFTCVLQSVTSRSREFPFPGICLFFWWYRNRYRKNLVPKKVPEPVSKIFGTEKKSRNRYRKNLVPKKVSESVSENFSTEKSLGIGLEKIWYRKVSESGAKKIWYWKVPEPDLNFVVLVSVSSRSRDFCLFFMVSESVSKKIWYRKKSRNRSRFFLVPKKVSEPVSKKIWYRKKSRNRSRKILVPKKNIGTSLEIFQNISVDLGPGLVPFPGFLQFFDGIGTNLEKNLVPKKVSEPVLKKMSTEKSLGTGLEKKWVPKKVSESVSFRFWVSSLTAT